MSAHTADIDAILARRHDNGADFWATEDHRIYVGNPFSTIGSLAILHELGVDRKHEAVAGGIELILGAVREDGRIRVGPKTPMYPCYTTEGLRVLCRYGLTDDPAVARVIEYLLDAVHDTGGWRCNFTRFGKGPETLCANPGTTLLVLDALRFFPEYHADDEVVDRAVETLLEHWEIREPRGPCHHGIGTLFMQVEYPFVRYNLFYWVYVLSFYVRARDDARFREALEALEGKLDDGAVVPENPHRLLRSLSFCAKGAPSAPATRRYEELRVNLAR